MNKINHPAGLESQTDLSFLANEMTQRKFRTLLRACCSIFSTPISKLFPPCQLNVISAMVKP
jgi:hypothetical protein